MLISNFEVLVKPIAPAPTGPAVVARKVVQAYFLTISNLDPNNAVSLDIDFTSFTPGLNDDVTSFFDVAGTNEPSALSPVPGNTKKKRRTITIPACDTGLFLLQPNLQNPGVLDNANLEVRGFVEILVAQASPTPNAELLVTPQSRGTFIPSNLPGPVQDLDFDQVAYSLPLAGGRAQINL